jgi:hypothetical protein
VRNATPLGGSRRQNKLQRSRGVQLPGEWEKDRNVQDVIRRALHAGPYTALFTERLWKLAATRAYWDSLEVLQCVRWYSVQRVESAIKRALRFQVEGVEGLRAILEDSIDGIPTVSEDLLDGQLLFDFLSPSLAEEETPCNVESHLSRKSQSIYREP